MAKNKKYTDRALFEDGGLARKNQGVGSYDFSSEADVSWNDDRPGLTDPSWDLVIPTDPSLDAPVITPFEQIPGGYGSPPPTGRKPLNQNPTEFVDADALLQLMLAGKEQQKSPGKAEQEQQNAPGKEVIREGTSGAVSGGVSAKSEEKKSVIRGGASEAVSGGVSAKSEEKTLLEKLLGGPDPYGAKSSVGSIRPQVPSSPEKPGTGEDTEDQTQEEGSGITDTETDGYIETLRSILDPNYGAQVSEDVMGQYATMTGGRPSSAAISAGTAAKADAETALLRELLADGSIERSGDGLSVLGKLLGKDALTTDVPEEYAGYADLVGYETIVPMLNSLDSEEDMGNYLADMVNKGVISDTVAIEYLKRFDDPYEVYDAGGRIDYASMVQNVGGWEMTDDGGANFFGGMNRNMKIKAPNGQEFTVAQLYRLLKKNGMDDKAAKDYLVKLQNYLQSKGKEEHS